LLRTRQALRIAARESGVVVSASACSIFFDRRRGHWHDGRGGSVDDPQGERGAVVLEGDVDAAERLCGAMLDGEDKVIAIAAQVEVGITPGVEFGRAAQGLTGSGLGGALARVVDEDDGDGKSALQLAQIGEQRGDLAGNVFVDAV